MHACAGLMAGCEFSKFMLSPPTGAVHWGWLQHGSDWKRSSVLGQPNIYLRFRTNSFRFFLPAISFEAKVRWGYLPISAMFEKKDAKLSHFCWFDFPISAPCKLLRLLLHSEIFPCCFNSAADVLALSFRVHLRTDQGNGEDLWEEWSWTTGISQMKYPSYIGL